MASGAGVEEERGELRFLFPKKNSGGEWASRGLAVGGIATSLRVPPVARSGALGVGVASRGRGSERPATRAGWSPAAGD